MATIKGAILEKLIDDDRYAVRYNAQRTTDTLTGLKNVEHYQYGTRIISTLKGSKLDNQSSGNTTKVSAYPRQVPLEIPWKKAIFDSSN